MIISYQKEGEEGGMKAKLETWGSGDSFYQQSTLSRPSLIYQFLLIKSGKRWCTGLLEIMQVLRELEERSGSGGILEVNLCLIQFALSMKSYPYRSKCRLILKGYVPLFQSIIITHFRKFQSFVLDNVMSSILATSSHGLFSTISLE
jgi:hypothetical protein